jgi:hypothetical protein
VQRFHQFLQQEFCARIWRLLETLNHGGGEFGVVELGHFGDPAGLRDIRRKPTPADGPE